MENNIKKFNLEPNGIPFGSRLQTENGEYNLIPVNPTRIRGRFFFAQVWTFTKQFCISWVDKNHEEFHGSVAYIAGEGGGGTLSALSPPFLWSIFIENFPEISPKITHFLGQRLPLILPLFLRIRKTNNIQTIKDLDPKFY